MNIYVASSWHNTWQEHFVRFLRSLGHEAYDFKTEGVGNFHWLDLDDGRKAWNVAQARRGFHDPRCLAAFMQDYDALHRADACILLLPSGRSAHLEAGWCIGQGKPTAVYAPEPIEPELMYLLASNILVTEIEVYQWTAAVAAAVKLRLRVGQFSVQWAERPLGSILGRTQPTQEG